MLSNSKIVKKDNSLYYLSASTNQLKEFFKNFKNLEEYSFEYDKNNNYEIQMIVEDKSIKVVTVKEKESENTSDIQKDIVFNISNNNKIEDITLPKNTNSKVIDK